MKPPKEYIEKKESPITVSLRIDKHLKSQIDKAAKHNQTSQNAWIKGAVKYYLQFVK